MGGLFAREVHPRSNYCTGAPALRVKFTFACEFWADFVLSLLNRESHDHIRHGFHA